MSAPVLPNTRLPFHLRIPLSAGTVTFGAHFGRFYIYANLLVRRREFNVLPDASLAIAEVTRRAPPPSDRLRLTGRWRMRSIFLRGPATIRQLELEVRSTDGFPFVADSGPDYSENHLLVPHISTPSTYLRDPWADELF